ncbi:hydrogenase formation protein HypD [Aquabacterium sp. A7-Y]|uniref:hydrogenase formation protein HypD n=1 Tax=Aquabacterium sp. A7-Y TaxID=1349605 RepID=UPI00223CA892|nr:hydrogenase formation protein HypD [Aquabacterium sp. A7-Y]MCW7541123.1 hydrogenase formation protein HypD [Aquabacterium sp. A7-Y]
MKFVNEFRDAGMARRLAATLKEEVDPARHYAFMEFCGGHTHTIARYGIEDVLPPQVRMIHGPGCPVCVLPTGRIDSAIALARRREVILCTYADLMRVPGSHRSSLMQAKAEGCDIRMVYATSDVFTIARAEPSREVVFLAIGFETTTPATAVALHAARAAGLRNFSVLCNHVMTPPAMQAIIAAKGPGGPVRIDGFVGPAHVSTVIGTRPYERFAGEGGRPVVVAGFEPLDVLLAVLMLVRQLNEGRCEVENQYTRAVTRDGNRRAQQFMAATFSTRPAFEWRGLGVLPRSALALSEGWAEHDAERRFGIEYQPAPDHPACECPAVLRGAKQPRDCKLFGVACTPETPVGACMVSSEGACAAAWTYGRCRSRERAQ